MKRAQLALLPLALVLLAPAARGEEDPAPPPQTVAPPTDPVVETPVAQPAPSQPAPSQPAPAAAPGKPAATAVKAARSSNARNPVDVDEDETGKPPDRISKIASKFRGSIFLFDQSITPETVSRGAAQSAIPSYQWWLSLRPRYYIKKYLSIRARLDLTLEWTNAGSETTYKRQPLIGDLWTDLAYTPKKFWGISTVVTMRAVWGTSLDSRADTSVARVGPAISFARSWETKFGDFEPTFGIYALYNFVRNTSGGVQHEYSCTSTDFTPTSCGQSTGVMNPQVSLVTSFGFRYSPHPKVGIGINYILLDSWAYRVPKATLVDATGGTTEVPTDHDQRFRQSSWFLASLDYDPTSWLGLSVGYYTVRSVRDPDGSIGNPLYANGGRTRIFLTTSFNLDKVYETIARRLDKKSAVALAR